MAEMKKARAIVESSVFQKKKRCVKGCRIKRASEILSGLSGRKMQRDLLREIGYMENFGKRKKRKYI